MPLTRPTLVTLVAMALAPAAPFARADEPTTAPSTLETPAPSPTTEPAGAAAAPVTTVASLASVFRMTLKNGFISVTTDMKPMSSPVRLRAPGLVGDGEVLASAATNAVEGNDALLRSFRFASPPDAERAPSMKTMLFALPNSVNFSQDSEEGTVARSVQYLQALPYDDDASDEPPVKLYVSVTDVETGASKVKLQLGAESFDELRRKYPREVSEHLVPVLATLQQDAAVLAPELTVARQALRAEAAPDPELATKVKGLVAQLGSPDATARDAAYTALADMGEPAAQAAAATDRATLSAEQNSLVDTLLAANMQSSPDDARRLAEQPAFLVDCLYLDDATLRTRAFERLKAMTKQPLEFDARGSEATRRQQSLKVRALVSAWSATQPAFKDQ